MNTSRTICPVCKSENDAAVLECRHCGALLNDFPTDLVAVPDLANMPAHEVETFIDSALIPEDGIGIHVAGALKPYYLTIYKELIIGRPVDATLDAVLDLSELAAYAMGVSRQHAKIRRTEAGFEIMDLNSRNGTWLNAERLTPNKAYPFASGSQIRIGKMRLLIVYRSAPKKSPHK